MTTHQGDAVTTSLPVSAIEIGERHRHDLSDLDSMAASIERSGLLHPIVLGEDHKLIAGYR